MAFDISQILKQRPIGEAETTLGKLYVYRMTMGGQGELHTALGKEIEKIEPTEFMKELTRFISYPENLAGQLKPR